MNLTSITHLKLTIDLESGYDFNQPHYNLLIQGSMSNILPTATSLTALEHLSITVLKAEENNELATFISAFLTALPHQEKLKTLEFDINEIMMMGEDDNIPQHTDLFIQGVLACTHLNTFRLRGNYI